MVIELHTQNMNRDELRQLAISNLRMYTMLGYETARVYWSRVVSRLNKREKGERKTVKAKTFGMPLRHAKLGVLV